MGLSVAIGMHMILNISLVGCKRQTHSFGLFAGISLLKGTTVGLLISKLFSTCWGMLFQVFRLGYLYLGRVCLEFVSGAVVCIRLF